MLKPPPLSTQVLASVSDDGPRQGVQSNGLLALLKMKHSLNFHFSRQTQVNQYQNVSILDFIGANDDGGGVTTGAIKCANLQSNRHHQLTNTQFLTGRRMSPKL